MSIANSDIQSILKKDCSISRSELISLLSCNDPNEIELIRKKAESILFGVCGQTVYYRGLIEFSNICACNCNYCGIRKSNRSVNRYTLTKKEIMEAARLCADYNYGSVVLQSGECTEPSFIDFVEDIVISIKNTTRSDSLPNGLGITLCIGEQTPRVFERLYRAGAHRYLLRIETTSPELFSQIHPPAQKIESRIRCLKSLREIGYQVGTGVMIGLPDQTIEHLADDIIFFKDMNIDMIGMGPYIPHPETPMGKTNSMSNDSIFSLALKMIAITRIVLKDVNIAATTALQTLDPIGREKGLQFGANVLMPQLTPIDVRKNYILYDGKPCLDESARQCRTCLSNRIKSAGRNIGYNQYGDSLHFFRRQNQKV